MSKDKTKGLDELETGVISVPMQGVNFDGITEIIKLFRPFEGSPRILNPFEPRENRKP